MNITDFREKVLKLNLNHKEIKRINNLTSKYFKFLLGKKLQIREVTDKNYKEVWYRLNGLLAKDDKFHRQQTHRMRNSKVEFVDFSHLAYNNSSEDL